MNKQNSSAKSTHNKIDVSPLILIGGFFTPILPASFVQFLTLISADNRDLVLLGLDWKKGAMSNPRWGYFRIISGTIGGGVLGFYFMHRAELKYKVCFSLFRDLEFLGYSRLN